MKIAEKTMSEELEDELDSITQEDTALQARIDQTKERLEKDIND
jgi:molecular chaperone GrpE (heat shock protein)